MNCSGVYNQLFNFRSRAASAEAKIPTVRDASPISSASSDSESSEEDDDEEDESASEESGSDSEQNDEEENERKRKQHKVEKMEIDKKVDDGKKVIHFASILGRVSTIYASMFRSLNTSDAHIGILFCFSLGGGEQEARSGEKRK